MAKIVIELPGKPQGKERPRLGRHGKVYTPVATKSYEGDLGWAAKIAMNGRKPLWGPLRVTVTAFIAIPESYKHEDRRRALAGELWPRTDTDNYAKAALDALNGIAYLDDSQVVDLRARKAYAVEPLTRIEIEPLGLVSEKSSGKEPELVLAK
jgi:Holliday junction resolvase RusA-like endonuclease